MVPVAIGAATLITPALVALATPGYAQAAAVAGNSSAGDTISSLQQQGYNVQVNGSHSVPLAQCGVTDINGLSGDTSHFSTVYVTVDCPDNV
jgi:hypothetical protein